MHSIHRAVKDLHFSVQFPGQCICTCCLCLTVGIRCIQPPEVFPLTAIVNKSCKLSVVLTTCFKSLMFSHGLEFELSLFRRTTI